MNIASNPWSFVPGDIKTGAIAAASGMVLNGDGTVTMTLTGAPSPSDFAVGDDLAIFGVTNAVYNGFYGVLVKTSSTVYTLMKQDSQFIPRGTAASTSGTAALCQYISYVRGEDISWQNITTAGNILKIVDRMGNSVWEATAYAPGFQNRGKIFWINGLALVQMDSGKVFITVN